MIRFNGEDTVEQMILDIHCDRFLMLFCQKTNPFIAAEIKGDTLYPPKNWHVNTPIAGRKEFSTSIP